MTFLFQDPPTTEIYTLSLHDALPISVSRWSTDEERAPIVNALNAPAPPTTGLPAIGGAGALRALTIGADRKSTRLNSSHVEISYAVFCLKKKTIAKGISWYSPVV